MLVRRRIARRVHVRRLQERVARERVGRHVGRERLEPAKVRVRVPVEGADSEGLSVVTEVDRPRPARRHQVLEDRPQAEPLPEEAGQLLEIGRAIDVAARGRGVNEEAVRPGGAGNRREPAVADHEAPRQGRDDRHEARVEPGEGRGRALGPDRFVVGIGLAGVVREEAIHGGRRRVCHVLPSEHLHGDVLELVPGIRVCDVERAGDAARQTHAGRITYGHRLTLVASQSVDALGRVIEADEPEQPIERLVFQHQYDDVPDFLGEGHTRAPPRMVGGSESPALGSYGGALDGVLVDLVTPRAATASHRQALPSSASPPAPESFEGLRA
jgi:hypothetical protein